MDPTVRLTRAQVRELDRLAIEEYGLPGVVLMENAGAGAARIALELLAEQRERVLPLARVAILCGPGNNGGDGWVVARHLANHGVDVRVVSLVETAALRGDAATMASVALKMGIRCDVALSRTDLERLRPELARAGLLVDALLGTGASGAPRPPIAAAIELCNDLGRTRPVLALDLPSGLDADTGEPAIPCVRASATATFAAEKTGFANPLATAHLGRVTVVDIGAPGELLTRVRGARLTSC